MQALPNRRRKGQSGGMRGVLPSLVAVTVAGCGQPPAASPELPAPVSWTSRIAGEGPGEGPLVMAHGGQGSPASRSTAVATAVARAWEVLEEERDARRAVIAVSGVDTLPNAALPW